MKFRKLFIYLLGGQTKLLYARQWFCCYPLPEHGSLLCMSLFVNWCIVRGTCNVFLDGFVFDSGYLVGPYMHNFSQFGVTTHLFVPSIFVLIWL